MSPQMTLISVLMITTNLVTLNAHSSGSYYARGGAIRAGEARGTVIRGPNDGFYAHGEARGFRAGGGEISGRYRSWDSDRRRLTTVRGGGIAAGGARGTVVRGPNGAVYAHGAGGIRGGAGEIYDDSSSDRRRLGHSSGGSYYARGGGIAAGGARGTVVRGPNGAVYAHGQARGFRAGGGSVYGRNYHRYSSSWDRRRLTTVRGGGIEAGGARGTVVYGPNEGVYAHGAAGGIRAGGGEIYDDSSSDRRRLQFDEQNDSGSDRRRLQVIPEDDQNDHNSDRRRLGSYYGRGGGIAAGGARGTVVRGPNDGFYAHGAAGGFRAGGGEIYGRYSSSWDRRRLGGYTARGGEATFVNDGGNVYGQTRGFENVNGRYRSWSNDVRRMRNEPNPQNMTVNTTTTNQPSNNSSDSDSDSVSDSSDDSDRRRLIMPKDYGRIVNDDQVGRIVNGNDNVMRRLLGHNNGNNKRHNPDDSDSYYRYSSHNNGRDYRQDGYYVRGGRARGTVVRGPNDGVYVHGEVRGYRGGRYYGSYDGDSSNGNGKNEGHKNNKGGHGKNQ